MTEDRLTSLRDIEAPRPADAARARALAAAMAAFDAETRNSASPIQGVAPPRRHTSIFDPLKRIFSMDNRIPVAAVVATLLFVPFAAYLATNTALTPLPWTASDPVEAETPRPAETLEPIVAEREEAPVVAAEPLADATPPTDQAMPQPSMELGRMRDQAGAEWQTRQSFEQSFDMSVGAPPPPSVAADMMAMPSPMPSMAAAPAGAGDTFESFEDNGLMIAAETPVSTFSIDVDTAAYAYVRRMLNDGYLPQADSVRIEELINYFSYDYALPEDPEVPFATTVAVHPNPWNADTRLMHVGIQGFVPPDAGDVASNLVLLIDTSGSMNSPDKLPLLKRAFGLLIDQLDENDTISIVAYAGSAGVVLEPTPGSERARILAALDGLEPGGSTAGAAGIELAYRLAGEAMIEDGVNRVLLATDGDFNVGISDPDALMRFIRERRDAGISLSVLGFGTGNLNDAVMQSLAQNGNGNAAYIDSFREAHRVLVEEAGSTLMTIAEDVKIQVEFNPALVAEYRLIGYETRALNREDFNNDRVDAGDIGAGHTVTAIYEITPTGSAGTLVDDLRYGQGASAAAGDAAFSDEYALLRLRYKLPGQDASQLIERPVTIEDEIATLGAVSEDMRFAAAVAAFGQVLRGNDHLDISLADIRALAAGARGQDEGGYRSEFLSLIDIAQSLRNQR